MKKGFYINTINVKNESELYHSGVMRKIFAQINEMRKYFAVTHETPNVYKERISLTDKVRMRLPFSPINHKWAYEEKFGQADFIYFRKDAIDQTVYTFFRDIKKHNPNCKILLEIPTYPYDKEILRSAKDIPIYLKDVFCRRRLKKCVDRVVTFSPDDRIWGIRTIKTINGYDFEKEPLRKVRKIDDCIHVIGVAVFAPWHGYDRFLVGLGEYYNNGGSRRIKVHFVGDGISVLEYKELVNKYNLSEHVVFHGWKSGKELSEIYDQVDISLDMLGRHRTGCYACSSLKSRETGAKGLPMITACKIDYMPENYPYRLQVSFDDEPINMEEVIAFYDSIYLNSGKTPQEIAEEIRQFAQDRCSMGIAMKPVIDYINED